MEGISHSAEVERASRSAKVEEAVDAKEEAASRCAKVEAEVDGAL